MLAALAATGPAYVWARCAGADRVPIDIVQVSMLLLGLLAAGASVWVRCAAARPASLNDLAGPRRRRALYTLAVVHCALALAVSAWVAVKLEGRRDLPGDLGGTLLLWLLTVPWCGYSAYQLTQLAGNAKKVEERLETAVLVTQAGLVSLLASWALYWGADFLEWWDSLRLFLAVLAAFAFLAAPLIAASSPIRRVAVSTLIVLHFAGILTAVISAPPGPWIVGQAEHWIFRPYLSFMYLSNAYRFYAPEPGPASQLWCRIEYEHGKDIVSRWTKVPDMDDQGRHTYAMSLQYTRRLALTENVARNALAPPAMVTNSRGETTIAPYILRRDQHSPTPVYSNRLGIKQAEPSSLKVPMHPETGLNYQQPTPDGRVLLSSFARHLLHQPHPDPKFSDAKPVAVKIYRVQHQILPAAALALGADPRDWVYYLPYYVGKYDDTGRLLDPEDPFLYWLLPMLREDATDPASRLKCYVFLHAGDEENWIRETREW